MKKQVITLSLLAVVMCSLAVALLLLLRNPPDVAPPPTLSMLDSVEVLYFEAPIAEVVVNPPGDLASYTVRNTAADGGWGTPESILVGRDELPVDMAKTNGLLNTVRWLEATQLLYESVDDYALFGLTNPSATVKITDVNGTSATVLIGNFSPDMGNYYVQLQGEPAVYHVPTYRISGFIQPETSFMDTMVIRGTAEYYYAVQQFTIGGAVREEHGEIVISPTMPREATPMDLHTHFLRAPIYHPMHYQLGFETLVTLFGLEAFDIVSIYPSEALLAEYGLDQPYATLKAACRQFGDFSLQASEPDELGWVYVIREGVPLLYRVRMDLLPWLEMQFYDIMTPAVATLYLDEIAEVIIDTGAQRYAFSMDHSDITRLGINIDGRPAHRNNFMTLAETLRRARYEELTFDARPEGLGPELQVTYRYVDGSPDKVISFYPGPSRKYFIEVEEMSVSFFTTSLYLDRVIAQAAAAALPNE